MAVGGANLYMIGTHAQSAGLERSGSAFALSSTSRGLAAAVAAAISVFSIQASPAGAQPPAATPTSPTFACPSEGQSLVNPPELASTNGILKGTIVLTVEDQRVPQSANGTVTCAQQQVRSFRGEDSRGEPLSPMPQAQPPHPTLRDPEPGPTLRASVGDLVQLTFENIVNFKRLEDNLDMDTEACTEVGQDGEIYPAGGSGTPKFQDKFPNCLHASSTANIHFHGTHTSPNSTGDNVYLQIRPLPRDNQGKLTTTPLEATVGLGDFFNECTEKLKNPLNAWPATWADLPKSWTDKQTELLMAYQQKTPGQPLWDEDQKVLKDGWPIFYIGVHPYCFALPAHTAEPSRPPGSPVMGQAPGTHWYHAHKHGSTAINVANGMTGAFIIEGNYDNDLNSAYGSFILKDNKAWNTRSQKIIVLNQLVTELNAMTRKPIAAPFGVDFSVNGRLRPKVTMQAGEIQLWRIVNTSGRTAAYFMPPKGIEWQQIAQDGVQYAPRSYKDGQNLNKPFYMAPANRVDLLVRAPMNMSGKSAEVRIQNVMGRSAVRPSPGEPDPVDGSVLLTVDVTDQPVLQNGQPKEMPFLTEANSPTLPQFLTDISDEEWQHNNSITRTFVFNSKKPVRSPSTSSMAHQHTINDMIFDEEHSHVEVLLGATEEWIIKNMTTPETGPNKSPIDHPFHIHINPFQIVEFFDPNESFVEKTTGSLMERYVFDKNAVLAEGQCRLDIGDSATWKPCRNTRQGNWSDVFAIPAGRVPRDADGNQMLDSQNQPIVIPGYFRMRSRFVDYPGLYVMHCHILIHEDRGMMFRVEVLKAKSAPSAVRHH
jgi:FtsP/CotA-like multicopper oxidase with cupredoxin domain